MSVLSDVIAVEVHRKALTNITNEMAIAMVRTSGSPVVTEVMDFSTCILDTVPEHLGFSAYVLFHAGSSLVSTQSIASRFSETARPGDGWIINDPYEGGAVHQGDVGIVMPVFYRDELLGWTFSNMHVKDTGGVGVSGFAPGAHEVYEEGLLFPPTRIIQDGGLDPEWERFIGANVRMSDIVLNDIRTMISANNVGAKKLSAVVDEYGLERHTEYSNANKDLTESVIRKRIEAIPDGVYTSKDWNEWDGHEGPELLLDLSLDLIISGSEMRFEYQGAPQIDAFINSAYGAMLGQTMTTFMTTMVYGDLPVNGGLWRPVTVDIGEPGTVVNATPPAPVSNAHSEVGMRAAKMTKDALSQALALSEDPELRGRVGGQAQDGWAGFSVTGKSQSGEPTVVFMNNISVGIGGGAQTISDGLDNYGCTCMSGCGLTDVETGEASDPIFYLWRRMIPNSGGPGQFRGGQGLEEAIAVRGSSLLSGPAFNAVAQVPPKGFGGGLPASSCEMHPIRDTNVHELLGSGILPSRERLTGSHEKIRSKVGRMDFHEGDVLYFRGGGGGGVGDPLLREPERVAEDVATAQVTATHAREVYGVVLDDGGEIDHAATLRARAEIRAERIGGSPRNQVALVAPGVSVKADGAFWRCTSCDESLGAVDANWRDAAHARELDIADRFDQLEMYVRRRVDGAPVKLREYFCPACAAALSFDVAVEGSATFEAPRLAAN